MSAIPHPPGQIHPAPSTVAFIPLRGGSKSIPHKNIKALAGKPLALWAIGAAAACEGVDAVYVATDDEAIAGVVRDSGLPKVEVIGRSAETATDTASTESALIEFAQAHEFDRVVLIQATSPLLESRDLQAALDRLDRHEADSILSVVRQKRFIWAGQADGTALPQNYDPKQRPRRQEFEGFLVENGAFYITRRDALLESKWRLNGRIAVQEMVEESYFEIDEPSDWLIIEGLLQRRPTASEPAKKAPRIRMFVTDVDGVLTDAGMYYTESGDELKKFNTRDGLGMRLLKEAGIVVGIITTENTRIVERRAAKLKVDFVHQGIDDKLAVLKRECELRGIGLDEVAYIGDDLNDLECIQAAGLSGCPNDAAMEVKKCATITLPTVGGSGAVRAFSEIILSEFKAEIDVQQI